jgi:hypothetical protein
LIDSVIAKTPPTSQLYPQALFWRATLVAAEIVMLSNPPHAAFDLVVALFSGVEQYRSRVLNHGIEPCKVRYNTNGEL